MTVRHIGTDLIEQSIRLMPELTAVQKELLGNHPDDAVAQAFPFADAGLRPRALVGAQVGLEAAGAEGFANADFAEQRRLLQVGAQALDRIREDGKNADLLPEEELGLEAVVRFFARPAVLFRQGRFLEPPPPWGRLKQYRDGINVTARSVGRIQVPGLPTMPYGGTGFLVADDVVMTNCHVAQLFSVPQPPQRWVFQPAISPSVDFAEDPDAGSGSAADSEPAVELVIEDLIGMHDRLDLALLRVSPAGAGSPPAPLTLMSEPPGNLQGRQLYAVGYPAPDPRNDPIVLRQIFGDIYYVKRIQPGAFLDPLPGPVIRVPPFSVHTRDDEVFAHDASTLGGNSGSCVVDLETNLVAGLHYSGLYTKYNQAVALWTLVDDPLLTAAGVRFD
jgi:hypothetical protein